MFAERQAWSWASRRHHAVLADGTIGTEKVVLAKPQTYMNESGLAVGELMRFYKLDLSDLLVVCDDLDLPLGKIRVRARGASGGQHGIESIVQHLGGQTAILRVRIGIGRPRNGRSENVDFLLSRAGGDERIELSTACERAAEAVLCFLTEGIDAAMNRYNGAGGATRDSAPTSVARPNGQ
jgi:PTH1 family peptidyl-tRNA hydrolase